MILIPASRRDIEKPAREQKVRAFQAQGRPITNEDVSRPPKEPPHNS